ncbi:hypothetical protein DSOUD_0030 [Desulfuromonas soudanensis]|uniref:VCBS repeat-containing protein n=1 Tax=Desulfuromonas soudanensis TaxID=1603606 RepID=A0A0M5IK93_9BACT|nr:VCBS repeat-containing protein [Desulfuromonas soudanensis]ALC14831.1 hypothetical protein DSOUD_0030 [Desulfuromonas soudanensis]
MNLRRILVLATLFYLSSVVLAGAALLDEVVRDFKPLSGYLVMATGDEFLIDQDAGKGVAVGDLFVVVQEGGKIVHPVTKKVLGTLDQVKGVLQVTRVKAGYSYARPLGRTEDLKPGDVIRRYENIPALFWDYTDQGSELFTKLKTALPRLDWQDYAAAQVDRPQIPGALAKGGPTLLFVLDGSGLQVHNAEFQVIHAYPNPVLSVATTVTPAAGPLKWDGAPVGGTRGAAGYQAVYPGFETLGSLPDGTVMAAFARLGDRMLLATTDGGDFQAFTVAETLTPLARGGTARSGKLLALHWWQPVTGGPLYLAVTSSVEENQAVTTAMPHTVSGSIFQLEGDRFTPVREGLPYILGSFDQDGDGICEMLLGQNFDRDTFFGRQIKELYLVDGKVETRRPSLELPRVFPVQGSLLADLTGDGRPEAIFVRRRVLSVYNGQQRLYESPQQMGGSSSAMTFSRNPGAADQLFTTEPLEIPPVAADLDGDGKLELVAIAAEGSFLRAPGLGPNINKAWLVVLRYDNGSFVRGRLGDELDRPVQGLAVDGKRVLLVSAKSGSILTGTGNSFLLALPIGL